MKPLLSIACVALLAAAAGFPQGPGTENPSAQEAATPDLAARVTSLEKELALTRKELAAARALVDETVSYLGAQAEGARAMLAALDAAEEAGFTAGINFRSREILLAGLRSRWGAMATGLPKPPKAEPPPAAGPAAPAGR
ncbi:MAG: hypothetical protein AB1726_08305 [Planctomycetota bacterium]